MYDAVRHSIDGLLALLGIVILIGYGSLPEAENTRFTYFLRNYFDPYRIYLILGLVIYSMYTALRGVVASDRQISSTQIAGLQRVLQRTSGELEEVLTPRAEIVLIPDCCIKPTLIAIGVAAKPVKSLLDASVYADIPSLGYMNRVLAWMNPRPDPEKAINIHPGQHHHTQWLAVVGDPPSNQFLISLGYEPPQIVGAGKHEITVYVKARDAMVTERKVEIVFTPPRGVSARLL